MLLCCVQLSLLSAQSSCQPSRAQLSSSSASGLRSKQFKNYYYTLEKGIMRPRKCQSWHRPMDKSHIHLIHDVLLSPISKQSTVS